MSGMFGGGGKSGPTSSPVTTLRLQTSTRGRRVPLAYGKPRLNGNLIWYGDLVATAHEEQMGGKGGGGPTNTTYTYTASLIMGMCEGAINNVTRIWRQKEVFQAETFPNQTLTVQDEAHVLPESRQITVANGTAFAGNVAVFADDAELQSRVQMQEGFNYTVGPGGVYTFSGIHNPGAYFYVTYNYNVASYYIDACGKLGFSLAKGVYNQLPIGWMSTRHPTEALAYHGLAYVCGSDSSLGADAHLLNHSFEVDTQFGYSPSIRDASPKQVVIDLLTNPHYGANFPAAKFGDFDQFGRYCVANNIFISPVYTEPEPARAMLDRLMVIANSAVVYSEGKLKFIPYGDVAATANGVTYNPNVTPVYDLNDDHFLGKDEPVRVMRNSKVDAYNHVRVKFYNRDINYNEDFAEAKDEANIGLQGLRTFEIELKEVCDPVAARSIATLIMQRSLYIRNVYEFRLGWSFALLEPMDLVTLTDPALGMNKTPVRIIEIEEDEEGDLSVKAEEFPLNVCNAAIYSAQQSSGFTLNFNVAPGNTTTPVIFEPPIELAESNDQLDLWIATGGGANYGGCEVWLSLDNQTYARHAVVNGKARYGSLTAALAAQANPGIAAQTASVSLISGGQLLSGTAQDATLLTTLCYVGGEFMAYQTATLTAAGKYDLTTLNRGAFGSGQAARAAGVDFVRIDGAIAKIPLTLDYIGKTLYIKLRAFNQFGGALQSLADVSPYTFTVAGRFVKLAPADVPSFSVVVKPDGRRQFVWDMASAPKDVKYGGGARIKYRPAGSGTAWASMTELLSGLLTQSPYETGNPPAGSYDFGIVFVDRLGNESLNAKIIANGVLTAEPTKTVNQADITPGAVGTPQLAANAATDVLRAVVTNVLIGDDTSVPTVVATINYTPSVDGDVLLSAVGRMTTEVSGSTNPASYVMLAESQFTGTPGALASNSLPHNGESPSAPYNITFSNSTKFAVTAGVAYTFNFRIVAQSSIYRAKVTSMEFRMEGIKR